MSRRTKAALVGAAFLAVILAANYVTTEYGLIPVGLGLTATAGTYFAGLAFVLRDSLQDFAGRWAVLGFIVAGALLSYLVSDPFIALASGTAFLFSELADLAVYTPLRRAGYLRAAVASNVVGTVVDTFLFLWVAGFPIAGAWQGQFVGKLTVTAVALALVVAYRMWKHPVRAVGDVATLSDGDGFTKVACTAPRCGWTHAFIADDTTEKRATALHNETRRRCSTSPTPAGRP